MEIENARHFFASTDARDRMVTECNRRPEVFTVGPDEIAAIEALMTSALTHARSVSDATLAKAHPDLPTHFRSEYQRSIELQLESSFGLSAESVAKQALALRLYNKWVDWFNANLDAIRFPRE